MTESTYWRRVLREWNAIGWLAFMILMVSIGVGTLIFDNGATSRTENNAQTAHTAPNYMK